MSSRRLFALALFAVLWTSACGSSPSAEPDSATSTPDGGNVVVDDGTAMRRPCTSSFGNGLTRDYGRLDGILVAVVDPGGGPCNADRDHVHLQILSKGSIYDIAINVDGDAPVSTATINKSLTGIPWTDGWHTGFNLDYASLGVPAANFTGSSKAEIVSIIKNELANVNHISVYGIGYGSDGAHLIHRNGTGGRDGVVVTQPLSKPAKWRMFRFSDQQF
jgi:hypothetical protein